jgi:hypothetical protein
MEARHDLPQTPCQKSMASPHICEAVKGSLQNLFVTLDLFLLRKVIEFKLKKYSPLSDIIVS